MTIKINEKDLKEVYNYISGGKLVENMIDNGVSINSMAFILDTLLIKIDDIKREMEDFNVSN